MAASGQLPLDLSHRSALGAEDFLVSRSNAPAVELIDRWPDWPHPAALVVGPRGSGKTHLAHVWRQRAAAALTTAAALTDDRLETLAGGPALVVEDLDRGIAEERTLFHLLNIARERRLSVLLTSAAPPGELDVSLPDLRSRLRALPLAAIEAPDDALLGAVLVKLFADRQIAVEPPVVEYLLARMERSMAAAGRIVAAADRLALAMQRKVTRALVAEVLAGVNSDEAD
jgi:chromosomal replication initiation ATPase DnaA